MILNGIDEAVRRDDLADRCVFLHLPPVLDASRRANHEFWPAFRAESAGILGALLDALAGGLRELPSVRPTELPRMADFPLLGEAIGESGLAGGRVYLSLQREPAGGDVRFA